MKKFCLTLMISLFGIKAFSQYNTAERNNLIAQEASNYAKMLNYNVNPNTLKYDLKYQRLDLTLDPAVYLVSGTVTSHFVPNQNISSIYFDLSNVLTVSQVSYHGANLAFQQLSSQEIKIDFPSQLPSNVLDSLSINYSGAPTTANQSFSTSTQNGTPVLYTLSEPYGAQDWFPTKQSMNDKIDQVEVKITTPPQYSVASNGKFMSETILPSGKKLTFWQTKYPMAAYLVALGITNYTKYFDTMGSASPFPFVNYVYPSTAANSSSMSNIEWTKLAMDNFETYFGPYPFRNEKYGHMEFSYPGTCMEHQTMSSMSSWGRSVIAHEMAHQWFGDKITCGAWNDIWLNEGFATFAEHLTNEKLLMTNTEFMTYLANQKDYITSSPAGSLYVSEANLGDMNAIFSGRLTYAKGGYVLRMLKWVLGDNAFYQALKDYNSRPNLAYSYAKSTDFAASLQASTGKDFTKFFNDWLYGQGYPTYNIRWKQDGNNLKFIVGQTQSDPSVSFFEMPLPIKVTGTGGETAYMVLNNTTNNQYFSSPVGFTVASVLFNYEYQIIERNSTVAMDPALGTSEVAREVRIYPNPVKNELKISGLNRKQNFEIYSVSGILVKKGLIDSESVINVSSLAVGVYIIKFKDRNLKFIKE